MSSPQPGPDPVPQQSNEEWCKEFCPTLPVRIESIVTEWHLTDASAALVVKNILTAVKQSVST
jgi:hypothetical protein